MSDQPEWDGLVLRGPISPWANDFSYFPEHDVFSLFNPEDWKVDFPFDSEDPAKYSKVRIFHGPAPAPASDLSVTFTLKAPAEVNGLPDAQIGPFHVEKHDGDVSISVDADLMKAHEQAGSTFEMTVSCPSLGIFPLPSRSSAETSQIAKMLSEFIASPVPFDVRFSFPRTGEDLWVDSATLRSGSSYFDNMIDSGFNESNPSDATWTGEVTAAASTAELAWSDSDDDATPSTPHKVSQRVHTIIITDHSFKTYRAVLVWMVTGYIVFAGLNTMPLDLPSSQPSPKRRKIAASAFPSTAAGAHVSPKSVYRLAHLLEIDKLKQAALKAFRAGLTIGNAAHQLFSSTADMYDEIRHVAVRFVADHWNKVVKTQGMQEMRVKIERRELDQGGVVMLAVADALGAKR